jgi:hypothetical protein
MVYDLFISFLFHLFTDVVFLFYIMTSVAEPHHFSAAPGKNFDAAPAPTLLYSKTKFLKRTKV